MVDPSALDDITNKMDKANASFRNEKRLRPTVYSGAHSGLVTLATHGKPGNALPYFKLLAQVTAALAAFSS